MSPRTRWYLSGLIAGLALFGACAQVQEGRGLGVVPAVGAAAPGRTALVIGNAAYSDDIGPLKNPGNDATDMAATLRQLGFVVTLVKDANHQRMAEAIEDFSRQLRPRSVGVFYYAGHGAQVGGRNYLIPLGARITTEAAVPYQAVAAEEVLARMDGAGQGQSLNVIILDACRNAPFMRGWRSPLRGLAPMQATGGSLVAYATSPGAVAADGTGRNGTYTRHLLHFMTEPNLPVELMFKQVRSAVEQETNGQQIPWELSSLRENFSFHPGASGTTSTPVVSTPAVATPPPSPSPSTSGGTQVAVGVYPPQPQAPLATIVGNDGAEMVLVPAGEFIMGSGGRKPEEAPQHRVYLDAFYIDKYEVTNARFQQFVQATGHRTQAEREGSGAVYTGQQWELVNGANWRAPRGPGSSTASLEQHPVVLVSQGDAKAYCAWAGKRLPTEAEWEKAARGTDGRSYPWGNQFNGQQANFCDTNCEDPLRDRVDNDGYRYTAPVGSYESGKSPYGAYDMAGNVWEWVADWFDENYYQESPARNPQGPASGDKVVVRGGGWDALALYVRATYRFRFAPTSGFDTLGIRCAK
jgi:formylglycine-generating enzyme required for sulfatase activity